MAERVALITGASSGIGLELARIFAANKHRVALVARRGERLQSLADEIVAAGGRQPIVIACDLEQPDACDAIAAALASDNAEVEFIVNNAGFGLFGDAIDLDRHQQLALLDVNVRALADISLRFAPDCVRHKGGMLNVASVAGFLPGPHMAIYYASKAFVLSFSEALHKEMQPHGVRVTTLRPGHVPTGFQARAGYMPRAAGLIENSAAEVAEAGYRGLIAGERLVIPGVFNQLAMFFLRFAPRWVALAAIDRIQRRN